MNNKNNYINNILFNNEEESKLINLFSTKFYLEDIVSKNNKKIDHTYSVEFTKQNHRIYKNNYIVNTLFNNLESDDKKYINKDIILFCINKKNSDDIRVLINDNKSIDCIHYNDFNDDRKKTILKLRKSKLEKFLWLKRFNIV